jgi:hypothetical protein
MYLYADAPAAGSAEPTDARYRNVVIGTLKGGPVVHVMPGALPSGRLHLRGGPVAVATTFDAPAPVVGDNSVASDCARVAGRTLQSAGISALPLGPHAVRISARRDVGCVTLPVYGLARSITYELSFSARTVRGAPPRVCLWEETTYGCAPLESVTVPTGDQGVYRFRGHIDADASSWRLFLYADATDGGTIVDYRDVRLRPIADDALVLRPATVATSPVPAITWTVDGPARYRVHVRDARAPFVLALADAFSRDWHVRGLLFGTPVHQVEIDGYRNGWLIDARGDLDLTIEYAPARVGRDAMHVSQLAGLALLGSLGLSFRRWRRRRPRPGAGPRRVSLQQADLPLHLPST